ncbi:FBP1-like protein [Mya arenaria]|uniref:FBP1-like protein n=1 Tax=Mya arenaria TaxID=6604 RepID=A0ABY7DE32_MYAAR|nr:FBP1-like protein [Mya arenaria]
MMCKYSVGLLCTHDIIFLSDINECASSPCLNGGLCEDRINSYICHCVPGLTGDRCQSDVNHCLSQPCSNNGVCLDGLNNFTCVCRPGFTGITCDININECASQPCQNRGICVDEINGYICICPIGFMGLRCEISRFCFIGVVIVYHITLLRTTTIQININECVPTPCSNNATCVDLAGGYNCICAPGYTGSCCELDINECASDPCSNGGLCVDLINSCICICVPGYTGDTCQIGKIILFTCR